MTADEGDLAPDRPLVSTPHGRALPVHRNVMVLVLIGAGGTVGTGLRAVIEEAFAAGPGEWPRATFAANVSGALVLGFLLEFLIRTGPDSGWRRRVRLTLGTGVLGGYTTYSTFAVEVTRLSTNPPHLLGAAYAAATVVLGVLGAAAGYLLAARVTHRPRRARRNGVGP